MLKNNFLKIISVVFVLGLVLFGWGNGEKNAKIARADSSNLTGYAWSDNIGWVDFSRAYLDNATGNFSGYAWSDNIGWIDLAPTTGFPQAPNTGAKLQADGSITGWMRALSWGGGWEGWISMSGTIDAGEKTCQSGPKNGQVCSVNADCVATASCVVSPVNVSGEWFGTNTFNRIVSNGSFLTFFVFPVNTGVAGLQFDQGLSFGNQNMTKENTYCITRAVGSGNKIDFYGYSSLNSNNRGLIGSLFAEAKEGFVPKISGLAGSDSWDCLDLFYPGSSIDNNSFYDIDNYFDVFDNEVAFTNFDGGYYGKLTFNIEGCPLTGGSSCSGTPSSCSANHNCALSVSNMGNYGVSLNKTTGVMSGYAWGSDVVGWLSFNLPANQSDLAVKIAGIVTPAVQLTANPTVISSGESSVLSWVSSDVSSCVGSWVGGSLPTSGSLTVSPSVTRNYSVNCSGLFGEASDSETVTVTVFNVADDTTSVNEGSFVNINVLANDTGEDLTIDRISNNPQRGSANVVGGSSIRYANSNYNSSGDSFRYVAKDKYGREKTGTVNVSIYRCGDGTKQLDEQCDLGSQNGSCPATCNTACRLQTCSVCGNGICESGETFLNCPADCQSNYQEI